jgi:hypothetical protein
MREFLFKAVPPALALAVAVSTATTSFACDWSGHDCVQQEWRVHHLERGYDLAQAVRLGVADPELVNAVLGAYPRKNFGYNNGACIAYQVICDEAGNVIGRRAVLAC